MALTGRDIIYTTQDMVTDANVMTEVNLALQSHAQNMRDEDYLYWYRRGKTPIKERVKEIRPEICNRVSVANAGEIVTFKNGYFLTEPATYVSRSKKNNTKVRQLNDIIYACGKHDIDNELVDWFHTVGLAVLFVDVGRDDNPIDLYALDPRAAFVVRSYALGNPKRMGIMMHISGDELICEVWTKDKKYTLSGAYYESGSNSISTQMSKVVSAEPNVLGEIPFIEYQYNETRMCAFESALDVLDAIDKVESNRIDGIEQVIQNLIITVNAKFPDKISANDIRKAGMVNLVSTGENKAEFRVLTEMLDQTQTQTTLNNLYERLYDIAGVPYTSHQGGGTSDNVGAVYLRSGWQAADTQARNTTDLFRRSDREFQHIFLKILEIKGMGNGLKAGDFELQIVRNESSNLLVKCQAAQAMKNLGLAPEIFLKKSGLSSDVLNDISLSPNIDAPAVDNTNEVRQTIGEQT